MASKVENGDLTKWRDISDEEIKKERIMRWTFGALGAIALIAAISCIVATYQNQLQPFTDIPNVESKSYLQFHYTGWSSGYWENYTITSTGPSLALNLGLAYATYGVIGLIGLGVLLKRGIFYDREKALRPVADNKQKGDNPGDALARGYLQIRDESLGKSHEYLAFSGTFYSDPKRHKNLGPLVRAGALTPDHVKRIDDIHGRYENALELDKQKERDLKRQVKPKVDIKTSYAPNAATKSELEQEWDTFRASLPRSFSRQAVASHAEAPNAEQSDL